MADSKTKYGLYVQTSKRNYQIMLIASFVYLGVSIFVISIYSLKMLVFAPILTIFFYRFLEYQYTGIHIEFLFASTDGGFGKISAYSSLLSAIFGLLFFLYLGAIS